MKWPQLGYKVADLDKFVKLLRFYVPYGYLASLLKEMIDIFFTKLAKVSSRGHDTGSLTILGFELPGIPESCVNIYVNIQQGNRKARDNLKNKNKTD